MYRHGLDKRRSAQSFRKASAQTKYANVRSGPMRGGIRL